MCTTCGCSENTKATVTDLKTGATHTLSTQVHHHHVHKHEQPGDESIPHEHHHAHDHPHEHVHSATVNLEVDVLARNNLLAERNRGWFEGRNMLALNLLSSPGAGKTTLLEHTIRDLGDEIPISVVEGDQETSFDAERIFATGCKTVQINTGTGCHLEAEMLASALKRLDPNMNSLMMIENVGNLVCPALFDLGEQAKIVILSVTEGTDKPLKYPHMFRVSNLMILNKIDLFPYVDFDVDRCVEYARRVNPEIEVLSLSATTGEGLDKWYAWLRERIADAHIESRP